MNRPDHNKSPKYAGKTVVRPEVFIVNGDVPPFFCENVSGRKRIALDVETDGLDYRVNNIGSIQIFNGSDAVCIVRPPFENPVSLEAILADKGVQKIFHHALFDLRFLRRLIGAKINNIACTKVSAKIVNPPERKNSLANLLKDYLNVEIDKSYQVSDWMRTELSEGQLRYAANDVVYLPELLDALIIEAKKNRVLPLLKRSFEYIPTRVELDLRRVGDVFVY